PTREATPGADPTQPHTWLALIHIEIESPDKVASLRPRMFRSYVSLRNRHQLPVLPIGLYLKVGLDGIGIDVFEENFWDLDVVRLQYLYVGLPGLKAIEYIDGDNWLGVALAALMEIPKDKIALIGAEAQRRLLAAPLTDQQRFLLRECVQAYLPIDEDQKRQLNEMLATEKYSGVQAMNKTVFEEGIEKGIEKGIETERREAVRELIEGRFGALSSPAAERLDKMSLTELMSVRKSILRAKSLRDLGLEN
ncbi:MAG: hypothetical protein HY289_01790, partial [Planctomycetes bacterium]|nr:hypothetical protein [Planctomycetota bacterium]